MNSDRNDRNIWLHRFAVLTALATLALIGIGGLVTSHSAGMSVPDWPNSYGYSMFLFPPSQWVGGILYEHTHRLWASVVGVMIVALTRWLGGRASRLPLAIIGVLELFAGLGILIFRSDLGGTGHFLAGIGGVVLLGALVWAKNNPAAKPLPQLGWLAFALVQFQGLLGGLRVVLFKDELGIFHATLAQLFFVLVCAIALFASTWWKSFGISAIGNLRAAAGGPRGLVLITTLLILTQLILGATMRHQHAGLAVPDFPLAYGKVWPAMDPESVARYNQQRQEITETHPITAAHITLHMAHRIAAVLILALVATCAVVSQRKLGWNSPLAKLAWAWFGLICVQGILGAVTVLNNKPADIATAHVLVGALSLAAGAFLVLIAFRASSALRSTEDPASAASFSFSVQTPAPNR